MLISSQFLCAVVMLKMQDKSTFSFSVFVKNTLLSYFLSPKLVFFIPGNWNLLFVRHHILIFKKLINHFENCMNLGNLRFMNNECDSINELSHDAFKCIVIIPRSCSIDILKGIFAQWRQGVTYIVFKNKSVNMSVTSMALSMQLFD